MNKALSLKVSLLFNLVSCLNHPPHQWIGAHAFPPWLVPRVEVGDNALVVLKDEGNGSEGLNGVLRSQTECLRIKVILLSLMPQSMCVL
jgi:hypothetical protein